jgi:phenylalanyl-tRNA synthetase beta chain
MLISVAWLRELVQVDEEPAALAAALTSRGLTVDAVTEVEGDTVLDIDVPANRPDALGHRGVAREVAAAFGRRLEAPRPAPATSGTPISVDVTIEDASLAGRYTARIVRGVTVGPSPAWVVKRLAACGLRSINNVVDASNLVMLELGQPVHFFDLARLKGSSIGVRAARRGERLVTLDGVARDLQPGMVVITDARGRSPRRRHGRRRHRDPRRDEGRAHRGRLVLPAAVRRTARALGSSPTRARGSSAGAIPRRRSAPDLAARGSAELAGGRPAPGTIDRRPRRLEPAASDGAPARAATLLGYAPGADEAVDALAALELAPTRAGESIEVTVPSWRVDLQREADVVEEIGRSLGYDRVPTALPAAAPRPSATPPPPIEDAARDRLASRGFHEAITYSMIGLDEDERFRPRGIASPDPDRKPDLVRALPPPALAPPGSSRAADQNVRRGTSDVRLFEVGRSSSPPRSRSTRGSSGPVGPHRRTGARRSARADAYDAAGLVEDVLALSARREPWHRERSALAALHPGQSIVWSDAAGRAVAWCGRPSPVARGLARLRDAAALSARST